MKPVVALIMISIATPCGAEPDCKAPVVGRCTCIETTSPKEIISYNEFGAQNQSHQVVSKTCLDGAFTRTSTIPLSINMAYIDMAHSDLIREIMADIRKKTAARK